jgi:hypothetical protein
MTSKRSTQPGWLVAASLFLAPPACRADVLFTVNLNTTPLTSSVAGPFFIDFQLNDGSGTGDANNAVTVSNFGFGGGGPAGSPSLTGGAVGDLSSQVSITDSAPILNEFIQQFTPGNTLRFTVRLSTTVEGPNPDQFYFGILDCHQVPLPTQGPADGLLIVNLTSSSPAIETFAGDPRRSPSCGGPPIPLTAPLIQIVPEPSVLTLALVGVALWLAAAAVRSRADRGS